MLKITSEIASSAYGAFTKGTTIKDGYLPRAFEDHLIEIKAAERIESRPTENKMVPNPVDENKLAQKKTDSAPVSQAAPASQEQTPKRSRGRPRKQS